MATTYPTTLQDLDVTRGTTGQPLNSPNHITHHLTEDDTIEALQAKVGITGSAVATTIDYKLTNAASSNPGHKHTLAQGATDVTATFTELNYSSGVTSAVQTQLDAKQLRSTLTAKGDLYVATASNTTNRQAVGTDGQVLIADSAQTNGIKWGTPSGSLISSFNSNVAIASSAVETTLFSATVPANTLSTGNVLSGRINFNTYSLITVTRTVTFRLKYGSTTIATLTCAAAAQFNTGSGRLEFDIISAGSTSAQEGALSIYTPVFNGTNVYGDPALTNIAFGTAAEDSTASKTFTVTAQFTTSDASNTITALNGYLYKVIA